MTVRIIALIVSACLYGIAGAQNAVPRLTRSQQDLLRAIVAATDAASSKTGDTDAKWQAHVMRASDGSHYVAFSLEPPADMTLPAGPVILYLRLATAAPPGATPIVERSSIREWLAGSRTDPRLLPRRNIAIGDMPAFGPGAIGVRGSTASTGSNELKLMAMERERARQEQEDQDRRRRAAMEGREPFARDMLPFEDFDLASRSLRPDGQRIVSRAFTAGPGDYDLFLAWADPASPKTVHVVRKTLHLPAARTAGLSTSSIILADSVTSRAAPYPPAEQGSHPYSIGLMEIVPAPSARYTRDRNISVAFQVINAQSSDAGMPDLAVGFRIVRLSGERESPVASLNSQYYNATTLPADFNLRLGHPLFAAVTAPLATLARGAYRLKVVVTDRIAGTSATADTDFAVVGTAASLLAEAPQLGAKFSPEAVLEPGTLAEVVSALTPPAPSTALARALALARAGKLVDLLVEEPVAAAEAGIRTALTGLAFLSVGDASSAAHFQRALQQGAAAAPTQFLLGAARAMQSRDPDAIAAWQAAIATGGAPAAARPLLAEAFLRRHDPVRAAETLAGAPAWTSNSAWLRIGAATQIANRREAEAIALLQSHLASDTGDQDARFLLLHALYAQFVRGGKPLGAGDQERFAAHSRAYIDARGTHAALAAEWLKTISSPASGGEAPAAFLPS